MKLNGLDEFLSDYPGMSLQPTRNSQTKIHGRFQFKAEGIGKTVEDYFELEILVENSFPYVIPTIRETAGKIPKNGDFHVNPDGTLCLGSVLRLKKILFDKPDLVSFAENCLVPYLFNVSIKLRDGGKFITGELEHGTAGIVFDYMEIFGLSSPVQVVSALELLAIKKRVSNKRICPCGCGFRLGRCNTHHKLNLFRLVAHRSWFSKHVSDIKRRAFG